jgi:hypothetical protein
MNGRISFEVGDVIEKAGVQFRYLGGARWEPVEEPLEKRFTTDGDDLTSSVRDAIARHGMGSSCS